MRTASGERRDINIANWAGTWKITVASTSSTWKQAGELTNGTGYIEKIYRDICKTSDSIIHCAPGWMSSPRPLSLILARYLRLFCLIFSAHGSCDPHRQ